MSLKAIHLLFIAASVLLSALFSFWAFSMYAKEEAGRQANLTMGILSAILGLGLLAYGRYFLKKLKDVSYL